MIISANFTLGVKLGRGFKPFVETKEYDYNQSYFRKHDACKRTRQRKSVITIGQEWWSNIYQYSHPQAKYYVYDELPTVVYQFNLYYH